MKILLGMHLILFRFSFHEFNNILLKYWTLKMPESPNSFCFELVWVERRKVREGISYAKLTNPSKSSFELNPKLILVCLSEFKSKPKNT